MAETSNLKEPGKEPEEARSTGEREPGEDGATSQSRAGDSPSRTADGPGAKSVSSTRRWMFGAAVFVGLAILVWFFGDYLAGLWNWFWGIDAASLRSAIQGLGPWAPLASTGLMVVHAFVPFPLEFLAIANGLVFGAWGGIAITWFSMVISGWAGYGAARFAGSLVYRFASAERLRSMEAWAQARSSWELVAVRFIPVISFSLLNLAMGLLGISFWRFTWTTALGIIPIVVVSVLTGHLLAIGPWGWVAVAILIVPFVVWEAWRRRSRDRL